MSLNKREQKKVEILPLPSLKHTNMKKTKTQYKGITYFRIYKPKKKVPTNPPINR